MNILYKYCDQAGIEILRTLELKLPYISQVNDPLECFPFFYCPENKDAIKQRYLAALNHRNMRPSADYERKLDELFEAGEIQKNFQIALEKLKRILIEKAACYLFQKQREIL